MPFVLAKGPGNQTAVQVWTAKKVLFGSKSVQKPDLLHLGGSNTDLYQSTHGLCRVCLDPSVPISGSSIRVFVFIVVFRWPIADHKIFRLFYPCPFLMNWPP
jgi:hypothetical protein